MGFLRKINNIGIYQITNQINGKSYIGSSKDIHHRLLQHKSILIRDKHYNKYLQRSVNIHGIENFIFSPLVSCPPEYLTKLEQWFINSTNSEYNELRIAHSVKGFKHTEETKRKISASSKNRPPISEETRKRLILARLRFRHSDQSKRKIGTYNANRFSKKTKCLNTGEQFNSVKEAANKMNLCKVAIAQSCRNGRLIYKTYKFIYI